jgi:hypothetical protein
MALLARLIAMTGTFFPDRADVELGNQVQVNERHGSVRIRRRTRFDHRAFFFVRTLARGTADRKHVPN